MKNKLRKIKIEDKTYLWKREHHHLTEFKHSKCVEKVTIYLKDYKNSPLQLLFREEDNLTTKEKWCVGYPDDGVIWSSKPSRVLQTNHTYINLNRPAVIAALINYFNWSGWNPKEMSKPFVENNALKFLEIIDLPLGIN